MGDRRLCLSKDEWDVDSVDMTITADHIYSKTCALCNRPALTFDRDNRAMCPEHATAIVRAIPVKDELPVTNHLPR